MVFLSANDFQEACWRLGEKLYATGWKPDYLLGLWRGGAWPCVSVDEYFRAHGWKAECLPLKCWSYTGIDRNEGELKFFLGEETFSYLKPGSKVLVVDDVFDTGKTARSVMARLHELGLEVRFAAVYYKPEKNQTSIVPDVYAEKLGSEWIVFPTDYAEIQAAK